MNVAAQHGQAPEALIIDPVGALATDVGMFERGLRRLLGGARLRCDLGGHASQVSSGARSERDLEPRLPGADSGDAPGGEGAAPRRPLQATRKASINRRAIAASFAALITSTGTSLTAGRAINGRGASGVDGRRFSGLARSISSDRNLCFIGGRHVGARQSGTSSPITPYSWPPIGATSLTQRNRTGARRGVEHMQTGECPGWISGYASPTAGKKVTGPLAVRSTVNANSAWSADCETRSVCTSLPSIE